ncbi:MAG TPA: MucB/RseB C-terminal domain-containing protein [Steroidobacteraceae bacterium]
MSARPAIAFALGLAAAPAFAESGQEWLARMGAALNNASYVGEFVSESSERTERLAITHRVRDGVVSERLVSLSGHGRELVRENDEVVVYLPDQKLAIIERRSGRSDLMGALPQFEGRMASWYKVDWVGRETLDDFGPTAVVAVRPLDGYRFGYRLWIDVDSHMPVRSDLADGSGRVIERLRFTKLRFDNNIPDSAFEPAVDRRKLRWVRQSPQSEEETPAWRAAQVPPGFRLSVSGMQALAGSGAPVNHLVYSDGLATVSVFIQTPEPGKAPMQGTTRSGVASAFTTVVDGHQVTAVGEVPPRTLKFIASGLRPAAAPEGATPAAASNRH